MADRPLTQAFEGPPQGVRLGSPLVAAKLLAAFAFAALGLFVLQRRLAGDLVPQGSAAAITALALIAWGAGLRAFGRRAAANRTRRPAIEGSLTCGVLGIGLGLASADWQGALVLLAVLLEEGWAWRSTVLPHPWGGWQATGSQVAAPRMLEPDFADPQSAELEAEGEESLDPSVQQTQTRSRDETGAERISGWQRVAVVAGAQSASAHVAFCPPLERAPRLEVHQLEGPESQIKVAEAQTFGARFDLRLSKPAAAACEIVLEYMSAELP